MSNTTDQNTTLDADIQETITSETTQGTTNNASDNPWTTTDTITTESDPWNSTDSTSTDADPWGAGGSTENIDTSSTGSDWLDAAPTDVTPDSFNLMDPFHNTLIPLDSWVTDAIDWIVLHFRPVFQGIRVPVDLVLSGFENFLTSMPAPIAIILFSLIAWQLSGKAMGIASFISLILIGAIGAWSEAMVTSH